MTTLSAPFILSSIGGTGSGKTFSICDLLSKEVKHCNDRYNKNKFADTSSKRKLFRRIYLVGPPETFESYDADQEKSFDKLKPLSVEGDYQKVVIEDQEDVQDFLESAGDWLKNSSGNDLGTLVFFDDLDAILRNAGNATAESVTKLFFSKSHHCGCSVIINMQVGTKSAQLRKLLESCHYLLVPVRGAEYFNVIRHVLPIYINTTKAMVDDLKAVDGKIHHWLGVIISAHPKNEYNRQLTLDSFSPSAIFKQNVTTGSDSKSKGSSLPKKRSLEH